MFYLEVRPHSFMSYFRIIADLWRSQIPSMVGHGLLVARGCSFMSSIERRPLHIAASCGHGDVAQLLLNHRADPIEVGEHGRNGAWQHGMKNIELLTF